MSDNEGLSLGYRLWWRIRRFVMSVFGPAQLGDDDPTQRLIDERAAKVAAAKARRDT